MWPTQGTRTLAPGDEFGAPLDPDLDPDQPVAGFQEYAKTAPLDLCHDSEDDDAAAAHGGGRKDGKAELLVIGRQEWISTTKCSRCVEARSTLTEARAGFVKHVTYDSASGLCYIFKYARLNLNPVSLSGSYVGRRSNFADAVARDASFKKPDPLKTNARVAFNLPAKGRREEHLKVARQYLEERVSKAQTTTVLYFTCLVTVHCGRIDVCQSTKKTNITTMEKSVCWPTGRAWL